VSMHSLTPDYSKRDCLLPPGCKDLIDVLNLEAAGTAGSATFQSGLPAVSPLEGTTVELGPTIMVKELAKLLGGNAYIVVADLVETGVCASFHDQISFETAAKVLAKYGVIARRSA
jgi:hypothetical protein